MAVNVLKDYESDPSNPIIFLYPGLILKWIDRIQEVFALTNIQKEIIIFLEKHKIEHDVPFLLNIDYMGALGGLINRSPKLTESNLLNLIEEGLVYQKKVPDCDLLKDLVEVGINLPIGIIDVKQEKERFGY